MAKAPTRTRAKMFIDLIWGLDGHDLDRGNGSITTTCLSIGRRLGIDGWELRDEVISSLYAASDHIERDAPSDLAGWYISDAHGVTIAWWQDGAESGWRDLTDCDDLDRERVGGISAL